MPKIVPEVLKSLRISRRLSLDQLSEKTAVNKQTIHRIEKGTQAATRERTIQQLARGLGVERAVLIGEALPPDLEDESAVISLMSKLDFRVSTATHNAMFLVAQRFNVAQADIVELAPFLFCWAAEASLKRRRAQLRQVEIACESARTAEREIKHLVPSDFSEPEQRIAAERESIEQEDLFGFGLDYHSVRDDWSDNPFALFLYNLTDDMRSGTAFEGYSSWDYPVYRVCSEESTHYTDGDSELAKEILDGHVDLNKMPKHIREKNWKDRAQWVTEQAKHYREEMVRLIERSKVSEVAK
jgi:transcriptional regulator with XRE-family HTH domain